MRWPRNTMVFATNVAFFVCSLSIGSDKISFRIHDYEDNPTHFTPTYQYSKICHRISVISERTTAKLVDFVEFVFRVNLTIER